MSATVVAGEVLASVEGRLVVVSYAVFLGRSARWVSFAGLAVLEFPGVIEFITNHSDGALVEQHPNSRGGGGKHPNSGVQENNRHCAALCGAVGVGPNSDVGEAVDVFWASVKTMLRSPRHSMSV